MNPDKQVAAIQKGQESRLIRANMEDRIFQREEEIIKRLVAAYRGSTLTGDAAMCGISEIAGLRHLLDNLDVDIRRGIASQPKE
tara:strand:+ start:240 stop:491 length:252 start_codon:yes stop_codon:yes gene_type:complete